jgi:hypothetical protein
VQRDVLAKYPAADLRVYVVWLPMLWSDRREAWDSGVISDPRAINFWDGERVVGEWFAKNVDGYEGVSWDIYYLYGPQATWDSIPSPLLATGATIYGNRRELQAAVAGLGP